MRLEWQRSQVQSPLEVTFLLNLFKLSPTQAFNANIANSAFRKKTLNGPFCSAPQLFSRIGAMRHNFSLAWSGTSWKMVWMVRRFRFLIF